MKPIEMKTRHGGIRRALATGHYPLEKALIDAMNSKEIERALVPDHLHPRAAPREDNQRREDNKGNREGKSKSAAKKERIVERATGGLKRQIEELEQKLAKGSRRGNGKGDGKTVNFHDDLVHQN